MTVVRNVINSCLRLLHYHMRSNMTEHIAYGSSDPTTFRLFPAGRQTWVRLNLAVSIFFMCILKVWITNNSVRLHFYQRHTNTNRNDHTAVEFSPKPQKSHLAAMIAYSGCCCWFTKTNQDYNPIVLSLPLACCRCVCCCCYCSYHLNHSTRA